MAFKNNYSYTCKLSWINKKLSKKLGFPPKRYFTEQKHQAAHSVSRDSCGRAFPFAVQVIRVPQATFLPVQVGVHPA